VIVLHKVIFFAGFVILVALVLIVFGAIVAAFFSSWIDMFIDNVSGFVLSTGRT
jgi:hypothetical protein